MAIKFNINALEDVDEGLRSQYKAVDAADPTKGFVLDVDGLPQPEDVGALKRSLENAKREKQEALERLKNSGNSTAEFEALRKSSDAKIEALQQQIKDGEKKTRASLLEKTVSEIANELGGADYAQAFVPHLRGRLAIETADGKDITRVLGNDGKASALSVEDLKNEFKNNKIFQPLIVGGKASGSGATSNTSNGGAGGSLQSRATRTPADAKAFLQERGII